MLEDYVCAASQGIERQSRNAIGLPDQARDDGDVFGHEVQADMIINPKHMVGFNPRAVDR